MSAILKYFVTNTSINETLACSLLDAYAKIKSV